MLSQLDWIFFDVGSTLVNEEKAYEHRMRDIAETAKVPYETAYETALNFYHENKKGDLELAKLYGIEKPKWYKEDEELYPDTISCLEQLSRHYKIGVIANQSLGTAKRLEEKGIRRYIDLVVASAEEGVAKPDPRIFEIAIERSKCRPERAVMIGDRIDNDIVPAKAMGMHTIWIRQGFGKYWKITEEAEKPEFCVDTLTELVRLFK